MPDAFFQKKRKRTSASGAGARAGPSRSKPSSSASSSRMRKPNADSDAEDDDAAGGIDDMDLTHNYNHAPNSDDEAEAAETPAEARVRLAKMYLQGLSDSPAGDDFFEGAEQPSFGLADAAQADRDNIAARLQKDVAEQSGKIHLFLANRIAVSPTADDAQSGTVLTVKGHRLSVTAAVVSADAKWLFTASKDGNIIRWRMSDGKMVRVLPRRARVLDDDGQPVPPSAASRSKTSGAARRRARFTAAAAAANGDKGKTSDGADAASYLGVGAEQGHTDEIWSLSVSSDGSRLASGGKDARVCIWDVAPRAGETFLKALGGHKDAISAVQFRTGSHELYTASLDRTLKLYDVAQLSYIETLFGHQESVLSLSCLGAETAVSAGGRDRTCRFWKIRDESQLVFRAGAKSKLRDVLEGGDLARQALSGEGKMSAPTEAVEGSVEVVAMIDQSHFVSGGDSGSVSLWNLGRKKPVHSVPVAHGFDLTTSESEGDIRTPRWITAVAALPYSDVFASASWDGNVRLWRIVAPGGSIRSFEPLMSVSVQGVVNSIQLVQPPLSSVRVSSDGNLSTNALVASKWKHAKGAVETEGKGLTRVTATKQNAPPLLIVAAGKEHRLGRWIKLPHATNATTIIPLTLTHAQ